MKVIPIKTNKEVFYRQVLEVLKSVPPINKLRPKELDVLAEIIKQKDLYSEIGAHKYTIIFSTENRKKIRESVGISIESFNNILSALRKYNIITKDNKLNQFFESIVFAGEFKLGFTFKGE